MQKQCAPSCQTCHTLDYQHKCPIDKTLPVALQPGDLNKIFERLVTDEYYQQFEPHILSQPTPDLDAPWVITLENFMSPEECDRMIDLGTAMGYKRSGDTGKRNFDGTYEKAVHSGRTSTNTFCQFDCETDPVTQQVTARIENVTGVPQINYEYLQLLRYESGQFYDTHHDFAGYHLERQFGPRIITVFLYLNDVEEGGATEFPELGLTVVPKKGKALIWPSVQNVDPTLRDPRTGHGALVVKKGIKYAANGWLHQGNFKDTYAKGCI